TALKEIGNQIFHHGHILGLSLLGKHSHWFVQEQNLFILIEDVQFSMGSLKSLPGKFFQCLLTQKELHQIPTLKLLAAGSFLLVQCDIFFPKHFIKKTFRSLWEQFCQILIQSLPSLIFLYGHLLHRLPHSAIARMVCLISSSLVRSGYFSSG